MSQPASPIDAPLRILLVDDNADDRALVSREIHRALPQAEIAEAGTRAEFERLLETPAWDVAITDFQLRWATGLDVFRRLRAAVPDLPVVMFTASGSEEIAVEAMKEGLDDYITKTPKHYGRIPYAVMACVDRARQRRAAIAAGEAKRHADARLALALRAAGIGTWEIDLRSGSVALSDQVAALVGRAPAAAPAPAAALLADVHPDDRARVEQAFEALLAGTDDFPVQVRLVRAGGASVWVEAHAQLLADASGRPTHVIGVLIDIDERTRQADALRASEERMRLAQAASRTGSFEFDLERRVAFLSAEAHRMLDIAPDDPDIHARWMERVPPADRDRVERTIARWLEGGREPVEYPYAHPRLGSRWIRADGAQLGVGGGRVFGAVVDVTEFRDAQTKARRAEERLRLARAAADVGTWEYDPASGRMECSPETYDLFGIEYGADALPAWLARVHPDDAAAAMQALDRCVQAGEVDIEYRFRHPTRGERWMKRKGRLIVEPEGRTFVAGVSFDITEQRRLIDQLREADRQKDLFLSVLAHELRGPLVPLANGLRLLQHDLPADRQAQTREMMRRYLIHLVRLVDDLLDVQRLQSGKVTLRRAPIALQDVLRSALQMTQPLIAAARHEVSLWLPPQEIRLHADETRLRQVFGNLLANAIRYTPAGGQITVMAAREGDAAVVQVRDSGIGIAPEDLPKLFNPFSQLQSPHGQPEGGLGLGLALVRSLTELHGGRVTATSDGQGKGSIFTVTLPLPRSEAADGEP